MNSTRVLLRITRWSLRILLAVLGLTVFLTGFGSFDLPGLILMAAGILLPGAELLFKLLNRIEKRIP